MSATARRILALMIAPPAAVEPLRARLLPEPPPAGAALDLPGRVTNVSEASYGMNSYNIRLAVPLQAEGISATIDLKAPDAAGVLHYQDRVRVLIYIEGGPDG